MKNLTSCILLLCAPSCANKVDKQISREELPCEQYEKLQNKSLEFAKKLVCKETAKDTTGVWTIRA